MMPLEEKNPTRVILETWHPDTNLQIEIDSWNGLEVVY